MNIYKPHLVIIPEDDNYRQIANGFLKNSSLDHRVIQVAPLANGGDKAEDLFVKNYASKIQKNPENTRVCLLIDFDETKTRQAKDRVNKVKQKLENAQYDIDEINAIMERVFVLGVLSESENLKKALKYQKTFEKIGETLATDCDEKIYELWGHELLQHNASELNRMVSSVRPFLFQKKP